MEKKLMIIDDEVLFGSLLVDVFAKDDLKVTYVSAGNEALRYPLNDLYIVDYYMPGMNGLDTLAALHQKFEKTVNALLITGYDSIHVEENYHEYEILAILQKPFKIAYVKKLVRDFFKS